MTRAAEMLQRFRDYGNRGPVYVARLGDDVACWSTNRRDAESRAPVGAVVVREVAA